MQNCVERETARATVHNGVAEHSTPTDERAFAVPVSGRHHSFVFAYYMFYLSLSSDTWDGGAQAVATMRAHPGVLLDADDCTLYQRKYQCIEEGETEEAITRCAGPPAAALSMSAGTRHNSRGG